MIERCVSESPRSLSAAEVGISHESPGVSFCRVPFAGTCGELFQDWSSCID